MQQSVRCALRGEPDLKKPHKKDRIIDCDDQLIVYDALLLAFDAIEDEP